MDIRSLHPQLAQHYRSVRNQDGVGWCHSFVASELLTAAIHEPVSAVDLASTYFKHAETQGFWSYIKAFVGMESKQERTERLELPKSAYIADVLESARKHGVCPESALRSDLTWYSDRTDALARAVKDLAVFKTSVENGRGYSQSCHLYEKSTLHLMFPNLNSREAFEAVHRARAEEISSDLNELTSRACRGVRRKLPSSLKIVSKDNISEEGGGPVLVQELDRALAGGLPAGVVVRSQVLDGNQEHAYPHAMTAVAREFRNGECKYFLRNSYGKGCGYYSGKAAADCDGAQGGFWISEDDLAYNFLTVTYVRK